MNKFTPFDLSLNNDSNHEGNIRLVRLIESYALFAGWASLKVRAYLFRPSRGVRKQGPVAERKEIWLTIPVLPCLISRTIVTHTTVLARVNREG